MLETEFTHEMGLGRRLNREHPVLQVLLPPVGPVFGRYRISDVVLPDPVDLEVQQGGPLITQTQFLGHAMARAVARDY